MRSNICICLHVCMYVIAKAWTCIDHCCMADSLHVGLTSDHGTTLLSVGNKSVEKTNLTRFPFMSRLACYINPTGSHCPVLP